MAAEERTGRIRGRRSLWAWGRGRWARRRSIAPGGASKYQPAIRSSAHTGRHACSERIPGQDDRKLRPAGGSFVDGGHDLFLSNGEVGRGEIEADGGHGTLRQATEQPVDERVEPIAPEIRVRVQEHGEGSGLLGRVHFGDVRRICLYERACGANGPAVIAGGMSRSSSVRLARSWRNTGRLSGSRNDGRADDPPSTASTCPVTQEARPDRRKSTAPAMSSGLPRRPSGRAARTSGLSSRGRPRRGRRGLGGADGARSHRVHPDPRPSPLERRRPGQGEHSRLCRGVRDPERHGREPRQRGDVDNAPACPLAEQPAPDHLVGDQDGPKVERQDLVEDLRVVAVGRRPVLRPRAARHVHQSEQPTEAGGLVDRPLDGG